MNARRSVFLGLVSSLVFAPASWAQPAVPAVPAVPTAVPAVPASPPNLWSRIFPNAAQKKACKDCFCNSPIGQMTSAATAPMAAFSGGLITNRCAANAIENDLANAPPGSSESAAAAIKKSEAEAKARRDAVRFLGTVDCNYWPEATEALILALRTDTNECVRFEAALALGHGCCCNEKTILALEICVMSSTKDKAPAERSDRVRAAAADALARCPIVQPTEKPRIDEIRKAEGSKPGQSPHTQIAASARGLLVSIQQANQNPVTPAPQAIPPIHHRPGSLAGLFSNAVAPPPVVPASAQSYEPMRNVKQEPVVQTGATAPPVSRLPIGTPVATPPAKGDLQAPTPVRSTNPPPIVIHPRESVGFITMEDAPPAPRLPIPGRP